MTVQPQLVLTVSFGNHYSDLLDSNFQVVCSHTKEYVMKLTLGAKFLPALYPPLLTSDPHDTGDIMALTDDQSVSMRNNCFDLQQLSVGRKNTAQGPAYSFEGEGDARALTYFLSVIQFAREHS